MQIRQATGKDIHETTALVMQLWPDNEQEAQQADVAGWIDSKNTAVFLAEVDAAAVGFAFCGLRNDYVEGTETSPVGYLEGVFIKEGFRRKGIAAALVGACEQWAREKGCKEFASDCALDNTLSIAFHMGIGFLEAGRLVCFTKGL